MDQLEAMRVFVAVAELSSFTQAARVLGMPRSSVTAGVQQAEQAFGTRLLQRTTRRVRLTQDGLLCFDRCRDVLADMEELQSMFRDGAELVGRLRVDMTLGMAKNWVIPQLDVFLARHPRLTLELGSTDRSVDVVGEGFDCVIRVGDPPPSGLIARRLGWFRMVNCAAPAYLARRGTPATPDMLSAHHMVHYAQQLGRADACFEWVDPATGTTREMAVTGVVTVNNSESYRAACLAGLGIIQVPEVGVRADLDEGRLVEVLPAHRAAPMPVTLLFPDRRRLPERVRVFMEWAGSVLAPVLMERPE